MLSCVCCCVLVRGVVCALRVVRCLLVVGTFFSCVCRLCVVFEYCVAVFMCACCVDCDVV